MFYRNVRNFRKMQGLTQCKFAEQLDVCRTTVSAWENKYSEPDLETLKKIKKVLNVSYEDLLDD
ncbi:MAG: helix-turn-helix transcriptional regulator [Clostridia bacterium]